MKRLYMILAMLAIVATVNATKIYRGNSTYVGNVVYTWDGKHLYQGNTTYVGNITYTTDGPIPPVIMSLLL